MSEKPNLPRITEPDEDLVHYAAVTGLDAVTLCGLTDFIGHRKRGGPTNAKVTCLPCQRVVAYVHEHRKPA